MRKLSGVIALGGLLAAAVHGQQLPVSQNAPPVVQADSGVFEKGVSGTLTVELRNETQLSALRVKLKLSPGLAVTSNATLGAGTIFTGADDVREFNVSGDTVDVILSTPTQTKGPGTLFTLPLTPSATAGTTETASIVEVVAVDPDNSFVTPGASVSASLTIQEPIALNIPSIQATASQTLPVAVTLASATQVGALKATIQAPDGLSIKGIDFTGSLFGSTDLTTSQISPDGKKVDVGFVSTDFHWGPGPLFTLDVEIPANAVTGTHYTLTSANVSGVDASNGIVPVRTTPATGILTVASPADILVENGSVFAGETVSLPVRLFSDAQVGSIRVILSTLGGLTFTGADFTGSGFGESDLRQFNVSNNGETLDVILTTPAPAGIDGPALLFNAQLQAPSTATAVQQLTVNINPISAFDPNNNPLLPRTLVSGVVSVFPACTAGDVNRDKKIDVEDAVLVLRYITGLLPDLAGDNLRAADANRDGKVNVIDAVKVMRLSVGLDPVSLPCL